MIIDGLTTIDGIELDKDELASIDSVVANNLQEQITNISLTPGPQGDPGVDGANGADGSIGIDGIPGTNGVDGAPGPGFTDGTTSGDMKYWDGSGWADIPAPLITGDIGLQVCNEVPTWTYGTCPLAIGDTGPGGGIVFHTTEGGLHGLEAAPVDQSTSLKFGCSGVTSTGALFGDGAQNTATIVALCPEVNIAVKLAAAYRLGGYNDWFLPSSPELLQMFAGGLLDPGFKYWSSTSTSNTTACSVFESGEERCDISKNATFAIRAIRSF